MSVIGAGTTTHPQNARGDLRRLLGLEVPVSVVLAERPLPIDNILGMSAGTIIEFEKSFDDVLSLHVNNACIAIGHAVKVGENFGPKIKRLVSVAGRLNAAGGS